MWNGDLDTHDDGLMVDASRFPRKSATRQHNLLVSFPVFVVQGEHYKNTCFMAHQFLYNFI
jgi:hypothetical protein